MTEQRLRNWIIIQRYCSLVFGNGVLSETLHFQRFTQIVMGVIEAWVHLEGLPQLLDRLVVSTCVGQDSSDIGVDDHGQGIELQRPLQLCDGILELAEWR